MATSKKLSSSRAQERAAAATVGGRVTPRSGAGWVHKADAKSKHFLVECKRTDNQFRLSLSLNDLRKIEREATLAGLLPAMQGQIGAVNYWVLTETAFEELLLAAGWDDVPG
jgi:hypothetical protein